MKQLSILITVLVCSYFSIAQPRKGEQAPEISLLNMEGKKTKLSDLKGKVVLIDFWASWCGPCRRSNKDLNSLYKKYQEKGFEIYGISLDEDKSEWKQAIKEDGIKWIQVIDGGWESKIASSWNIEAIPTSFLLDKTGKVLAVNPGKKQIESLLKQELKNETSR